MKPNGLVWQLQLDRETFKDFDNPHPAIDRRFAFTIHHYISPMRPATLLRLGTVMNGENTRVCARVLDEVDGSEVWCISTTYLSYKPPYPMSALTLIVASQTPNQISLNWPSWPFDDRYLFWTRFDYSKIPEWSMFGEPK